MKIVTPKKNALARSNCRSHEDLHGKSSYEMTNHHEDPHTQTHLKEINPMRRSFSAITSTATVSLFVVFMLAGCEGAVGPAGPAGADGTSGTNGTNGTDANAVSAADSASYAAADGVTGARFYDHVLNQLDVIDAKLTDFSNFFRCKACHGWDLLGKNGVLIDKPASASYPVAADGNLYAWSRLHNIREVFDAVKNVGGRSRTAESYNGTMPDYGGILTDTQIWDLVKFLKETAHDANDYYALSTTGTYPTGTKTFSDLGRGGDGAAGLVTYNANCAGCHGAKGDKIDIYCQGEWLGNMFRDDVHEIQHKAVWGMPNDREHIAAGCTDAGMMPSQNITADDIRNLIVMGQDAVAFPDFN